MGGFQSIGPIPNAADVKIPDESPYPEDKDDEEQTEDSEDSEEDDEDEGEFGASSNAKLPFVEIAEAPDPDIDLTALPPPEEAPEEAPIQDEPVKAPSGEMRELEVFGQEGGVPKDGGSTASAGILQKTLDNAKDAGGAGLDSATTPSKLTNEQRAAVMRYKLDREELSHVGGIKALDKIGDNQAAAALADTLYRHGGVDGPRLLQQAINDVQPGAVPKTGFMGSKTLEAYGRLASSPETKGKLLDALAEQRQFAVRDPNERARFDYYRYLGRR
jgi:hypothetical protein